VETWSSGVHLTTDTVNWDEQWALFAKNFKNGKAHIDLSSFGANETLHLLPGPGFGDLSHPTTQLMLEMMKGLIQDESVIDIGSGSGILTLAAAMLGAKSAIGIDIDPDAINHAKRNCELNHLEEKVTFSLTTPKPMSSKSIFLMNMIWMEQKMVDPSQFNLYAKRWIISGILKTQKKEYLEQAKSWGWIPIQEFSCQKWKGWIFSPQMDIISSKK
jgi:ribosomal protein L11 methyltransferase